MFTEEQMEAIETESEMLAVLEWETETLEHDKPFVPWMPEDGEETEAEAERTEG